MGFRRYHAVYRGSDGPLAEPPPPRPITLAIVTRSTITYGKTRLAKVTNRLPSHTRTHARTHIGRPDFRERSKRYSRQFLVRDFPIDRAANVVSLRWFFGLSTARFSPVGRFSGENRASFERASRVVLQYYRSGTSYCRVRRPAIALLARVTCSQSRLLLEGNPFSHPFCVTR